MAATATVGCHDLPPVEPPRQTYLGPTDSVDAVVQRVNANAGRVPTLWAQLDYTAVLVDAKGKRTDVSGDGAIMYRRLPPVSPDGPPPAGQLLLVGNKDVAGEVFQVGTDGAEFWTRFRTATAASDYVWGHLANVGKPCCKPIPIRPDLVVEVLGVGLLQTNLLVQPVPVMRFDNEQDAYVIDFDVRRPDRWVLQKQVWYDRRTALPRRVALYDDAGRLVLRADLSQPVPLAAVSGEPVPPAANRPRVARRYAMWFPDTNSTLAMELTAPAAVHQDGDLTFPNPNSFHRPEADGGDRVTQVDADCPNAR